MSTVFSRLLVVGAVLLAAGGYCAIQNPPAIKAAEANDPIVQTAAALYDGIRTATLPNGLRIYLKPVPGSPVVTTMVAYKVGSADEELTATGLSHYLEHLMFKGTDKLMPGDIDRITLRNGGSNNAYTTEDLTTYHFDFAADRWETALEIEADRMRNLRIDEKHEFQQEKGAVISELRRNEDEPGDLEQKAILPLLFGKTTPYGHPVIGEVKHVEGATAKVIKDHYDKWYHPNNAALIVCGGFDPDQALVKIQKLFARIPRQELPARKPVTESARKKPVTIEMESKFDVPRMLMGFNTVTSSHPDAYALDIIQAVLSGGRTSRLYQKLIEGEEIAGGIEASNGTGRYPGWFAIQLELIKGKDRKKAEELLLAELKRLGSEPISDSELKRVQRKLLASAVFQRESVHNLADSIARGVTNNDLDYLKGYLPRIAAVTPKEIQEVARKYFDPSTRVVVWSVPRRAAGTSRRTGDPLVLRRRLAREDAAPALDLSLKDAQRVVLDNGLTLLLYENHRLPIVVADASVRNTRMLEPAEKSGLANFVGRLLDEGTTAHKGPEIATIIEDVGGSLLMSQGGGSLRVLSPDRSLGLKLLFECLTQANFPEEAITRERQQILTEIDDSERQPESRASEGYRALVYGKHPFGRTALGKRKTIESLKRADLVEFYQRLFVPNNTVLAIVGDFDRKQVIEEVKQLTAAWKPNELPKIEPQTVEKPAEFTQKIITMPQAAQLHFYMGHSGITRDNPDFYKILVMDYVLGTGPGFTDRLSARLRDREGLAYTVSANVSTSAADQPGLFTCYIGTDPGNFAKVKGLFLEELNRIRDEKPKDEEVEDAKKYLLGNLPFQLTSNNRIAGQLIYAERYHLGFGFLDDYRKQVAAVTAADVQAMAKKYIDPKRLVLVAAGALDPQGKLLKPLEKPKEKGK